MPDLYDWNNLPRRQPPARPVEPAVNGHANGHTTTYGARALAGEIDTLLTTLEGARNDQLNKSAYKLGGLVASGHLEEAETVESLASAAGQIGLEAREIAATVRSGMRAGVKEPRQVEPLAASATVADVASLIAPPAAFEVATELTPEEAAAIFHQRMVAEELRKLRVREDAKRILAEERTPPLPPFDSGTLREILARPPAPPNRVEHLIPWEAGTLLSAQRKAGKTTMVLNLLYSLLTGQDFLGRFGVRPVDGIVAFLNYEVSAAQVARWADEVGVDRDRSYFVNLRGRRNPLAHEDDRQALADKLRRRGVETVVYDPFGRAFVGANQNDAGEVGSWLAQLDQFTRADVGARDLILTAHAGWDAERTRGSTALEDWADTIINLTRDTAEGGDDSRYLRALGRDVEVEEDQLSYDQASRRLTLAGAGSRKATRSRKHIGEVQEAVLQLVVANPGINGSQVERKLREDEIPFQRGEQRKVLQGLVDLGLLRIEEGSRGSKQYHLTQVAQGSPDLAHGSRRDLAQPAPIYGGGLGRGATSNSDLTRRATSTAVDQPGLDMPDDHSSCNHCGTATPDKILDDTAGYCRACARLWGGDA